MVKQLTVIAGRDKGRVFLVPEEGTLSIGRGSNTPTRLSDLRVSRHHCDISVSGETILLTDCNSAVGTYVNDQKVTAPHALSNGDVIKIGETQIKFQDADVAELETMAGFAFQEMMAAGRGAAAPIAPPVALTGVASQDLVGTVLANWKLEGVLARGQVSVIYRAQDTTADRTAAVKVLNPDAARNDAEMQRLAKVLQPVMELRHPHLVALYDLGKSGPHCWFAMELIEGENLTQVIQRVGLAGMLDWQHALRVGLHMSQALEFLHQRGIVHDNITPENILISSSDVGAKLSFLIGAKTPAGNAGDILSRPGDFFRDIGYMPPERAKDNAQGDIRSDMYSLGATLYALLAGRPPFQGKTPVETIVQIMQGEPLRPKEYQLSMPESFERAVLRMLAKQPKDRFQTPAELHAELDRIVKNPNAVAPENGRAAPPPPSPPPAAAAPAAGHANAPTPPPAPAPQTSGERGILVVCACGQKLQARERYAGTRVRCPACGTFLILPSQGGTAPAQAPMSSTPPPMASQRMPGPMPTASWKKMDEKKRSNPAVFVVILLALVACAALVGSFFWSKDKPSRRPNTPAKTKPATDGATGTDDKKF